MIYDLYLLSEYFSREEAIIKISQASRYYPQGELLFAVSVGFVTLSRKICGNPQSDCFFFLTDKGKAFVESGKK